MKRTKARTASSAADADASQAPAKANARSVAERWTPRLAKRFTPVSEYFLESYSKLIPPLTHGEAMAVIHLMKHKWDARPPHIGFKRLAAEMGISTSQARSIIRQVEKKKLLRRELRVGETNKFILAPLFEALHRLMDEQEAGSARPKAVR